MNGTEKKWLSLKEAAVYIGLTAKNSYRTLLRWVRAGKVKAGYNGTTYRFRKEDLDNCLYHNGKNVSKKKG